MALRAINSECGTYTVRPGDTLSGIAAAFHTTVRALVQTNRLGGMRIVVGQPLTIPGYPCAVAATGARQPGMQDGDAGAWLDLVLGCLYYVRQGDTPARVAAHFGTTIAAMRALPYNGPSFDSNWYVGKRLQIPGYGCVGGDQGTIIAGIGGSGGTGPLTGSGGAGSVTGTVPATAVGPGDQVKITLRATLGAVFWTSGNREQLVNRVKNRLGNTYAVINAEADTVGYTAGYINILLQAVTATTLANIAADCNYACTAAGFSVYQQPGDITAFIYLRGQPVRAAGAPLVELNPDGTPKAPSAGIFDQLAEDIGLKTGLPLTGAVVAGIVVIGVIVFLKT